MVTIIETLVRYVVGAVLSKTEEENVNRRSGVTEEEWQAAHIPYLQQVIATGRYPTVARLVTSGRPPDQATSVEFALSCILDGITSHIAERHLCSERKKNAHSLHE